MHKIAASRLALATAALLLVGILAAGCGSSSFAYSVNGDEVSQADFNRELEALADNEAFAEVFEAQTGESIRNSEGTISTTFAAQWMTLVINGKIMEDAAEEEDVEVSDEVRAEAEAEAPGLFAFGQPDGGAEIWEGFPEWFQEDVVDRLAIQLAYIESLTPEVTDEEVRAVYDQEVGAVAESCESGKFVSHLIVETEEEAAALRAQLDEGASFLDLTLENSTDPGLTQNQGYYDCFVEGSGFVAEFEAGVNETEVGEISGPVETEFGWHLIKIDAQPPFELVEDLIRQNLAQPDAAKLQSVVEDADVEVDDKYGEWVVTQGQGQVVPPTDDDEETPEVPTEGEINLEDIDPELLEQLEQQLPESTEEAPTGDSQVPSP